jgi:hypothetical protein
VAGKSVSHHRHSVKQGEAGGGVQRYSVNGDGLSNGEAHGDTGIREADWVTWSINLRDSGVDRHYPISPYHHTTKIHTLSFLTFGLTRSFQDFVDRRNCAVPHSRVVSYLLTLFLRSSSQNHSFS